MLSSGKPIYRNIFFHLICWVGYIAYEVFFIIFIYHISNSFANYLFFYTCNIGLFYWHFDTLTRYLNRTPSQYVMMIIMILAEISVVMLIKMAWDYFSALKNAPAEQFWTTLKMSAGLDLNRTIQYIYFSTVLWSAINFGRFRRRTTEAELQRALTDKANTDLKYKFAQAQNAFLKQQINPHLLFNTLNAVYSEVYLNSPKDSKPILLLSDIMRYSFEDPGPGGRVPLESELLQLQNLIDLNSYRFGKTAFLDFRITGDPRSYAIIPLVLITLTENMFKHGDLRSSPRSLEITIDENGLMSFVSKNIPKPLKARGQRASVGLDNTRLRLDYAYPGNYQLEMTETPDLFILKLTINLAYECSNH